ncbi:helix-turn-helix domain-containing protein [Arsenophonus nasoniae]|uniref:AraC-family transcriptional regulator n=1 Tax=Arsenophonus nasoniae TaxID=638 RepID=D2TYX5_9GAMM|nr:helix-turn-helix domain-containing protein [Arsenophonus nasoniae]QBY43865.1 Regulatory protein SoxS [Arsenophonus nasoniae]WGL96635.1 helix-turn-helix domain-containing protein [Arsenophonus nasoniae]WGM04203.1 helix-turn-helix domain-containing protein [Arsenophonus nasoniae]WGM09306.1 helix-turn-helix domain-containing protein [Arsenophonus nasoniae]WGM14029.1 helix-turn-helix domain-containing protein [Arsenophonus nasoniae]
MLQDTHLALVCELSKWIEEHIGRIIYLEELAAYSGYSLWHMQKIFKEITGISLGKYIRQRRLAKAVNLLRNSSKAIFDIALDFGFGSQSHFTYMFRKEFGITPYDFRQDPNIKLKIKEPLHHIYQQSSNI